MQGLELDFESALRFTGIRLLLKGALMEKKMQVTMEESMWISKEINADNFLFYTRTTNIAMQEMKTNNFEPKASAVGKNFRLGY